MERLTFEQLAIKVLEETKKTMSLTEIWEHAIKMDYAKLTRL